MVLTAATKLKALLLVASCVGAVKAVNDRPYCKSFYSDFHEKPGYQCFKYTKLPTDLENPHSIKSLRLQSNNNNLHRLRKGELLATKLVNLKVLELRSVNLEEIEVGAFEGGNELTGIDLSMNRLQNLNLSVFKDTPNLQMLSLDNNNNLKGFSKENSFPRSNLTYLSLSSCNIHSLNLNTFAKLEKLENLDLSLNKLNVFDWRVLKPLKKLNYIDFGFIQFHCDCKTKFLLDYLDRRNVTWNKFSFSLCASSFSDGNVAETNLTGIHFRGLNRDLLACPAKVTSLSHINVFENNMRLECKYSGYPEPSVTWTKNGKDFPKKDVIDSHTEVLNGELGYKEFNYEFKQVIYTSHRSSASVYKCVVSNKAGSDSKTIGVEPSSRLEIDDDDFTLESKPLRAVGPVVVLTLAVIALTLILVSLAAYIAVRYSKTKARLSKPKTFIDVNPGCIGPPPQTTTAEPPYPPLLGNVVEEPFYEEIDENNMYEEPIVIQPQPPILPPRNVDI